MNYQLSHHKPIAYTTKSIIIEFIQTRKLGKYGTVLISQFAIYD